MRKILTIVATVAAAFMLTLGLGTSAFAHADGPKVCNSGPQSACAKFFNDGDVIYVWDTNCDGHAAVALVNADTIHDALWNTDGCGTVVSYSYGIAMPENIGVYYRACYGVSYSAGTWDRCSGIGGGES